MRRKDREVTGLEDILGIVDKAKVLHLGLSDGDYPYIVPLHYGYEYDKEVETLVFYMHGARKGHKLDLIRRNPKVCVEMECDVELVSGGEAACAYGSSYASVIGRGDAEIIGDPQEKIRGLNLLMKNQTGREFVFTEQMVASVAVMKVTVTKFTAKSRPMSS